MGKRAKSKRKAKRRAAQPAPMPPAPPSPVERGYEAAMSTPSRRRVVGAGGSQDAAADGALEPIREWGRYLDENHDLASGVLDELVKNVIGSGIVTIPKPLAADGSIDERLGAALMREFAAWMRAADVTGELAWYDAQRLAGRAWFRDGEQFVQHVAGRDRGYPFAAGQVPYRVELLEGEFVPRELTNDQGWRQGVRLDGWRRPIEYGVYRRHPGDYAVGFGPGALTVTLEDVVRVPAETMTHLKLAKRWPATRGVSIFSSVISRLYDVKDLEESERIKNRILASWTAAITKSPDVPGSDLGTDKSGNRFLAMAGGTIIDTLAPGEEITGVGPDYPVANMPDHIADQVRRVASGTGTRYSSISKHYDGNYAAQRQELVESEGHYRIREDAFVSKLVRPVYERWLIAAVLDGRVALGPDMTIERAANAEFRGPVTPWIDPLKEVQADRLAVEAGFASLDQIRIKRGAPAEMIGAPAPTVTTERRAVQLELLDATIHDEAAA